MVAVRKKSVRKILEEIYAITGRIFSHRLNFRLTPGAMDAFRRRLHSSPPARLGTFAVKNTVTIDGYKFIFNDGSWLGVRLSGTEPVVRVYLETDSAAKMKKLAAAGRKFVQQ